MFFLVYQLELAESCPFLKKIKSYFVPKIMGIPFKLGCSYFTYY